MSLKSGISGGRRTSGHRWREMFGRRRQMQNPMLVFNMSIFNFGGGWARVINPVRAQQRRY